MIIHKTNFTSKCKKSEYFYLLPSVCDLKRGICKNKNPHPEG